MMKKVYVVSHGHYSDYEIDRIYLNEQDAKKYVEEQNIAYEMTIRERAKTSTDDYWQHILQKVIERSESDCYVVQEYDLHETKEY